MISYRVKDANINPTVIHLYLNQTVEYKFVIPTIFLPTSFTPIKFQYLDGNGALAMIGLNDYRFEVYNQILTLSIPLQLTLTMSNNFNLLSIYSTSFYITSKKAVGGIVLNDRLVYKFMVRIVDECVDV